MYDAAVGLPDEPRPGLTTVWNTHAYTYMLVVDREPRMGGGGQGLLKMYVKYPIVPPHLKNKIITNLLYE